MSNDDYRRPKPVTVKASWLLLLITLPLAISGCAGLSQVQDSASHLAQAAHAASTAESSFLTTLQTTECDSQFFSSTYEYSISHTHNFSLAQYCTPKVITDSQIKLRNQMMSALTLYADKLLALTTAQDNKQLSANAQTLASNLKTAATDGSVKLPSATAGIVAGVEAAFTAIAEMALDEQKYKSAVSAAQAMQPHIDVIVTALLKENYGFSQSITAAHIVLEGQLRAEIEAAPGKTERFMTILRAREVLANSTGATSQQLATMSWTELDLSKPINDAIPNIQAANQAIAKDAPGGVYSAAHDLYERSVAAKDLYTSISK